MDQTHDLAHIVHTLQASQGDASNVVHQQKIQVVVFEIDSEEFAVNILELQEIIEIPPITPIPNAPPFIKGLLNLRGKIIVVLDLEKRFGLTRQKNDVQKHIIIAENEGTHFGICVDFVKEILMVNVDDIKPPPEVISSKIHSEYLKGIVVIDGKATKENVVEDARNQNTQDSTPQTSRLIILMDLKKLLQEQELMDFNATLQSVSNNK